MRRSSDPKQMDLLQGSREEWLRQARLAAQRVAYEEGSVTAEDVRRVCPLPGHLHRNTMGKVFADRMTFVFSGFKKSAVKERKGGIIGVWGLTDEARSTWATHYTRKAGNG